MMRAWMMPGAGIAFVRRLTAACLLVFAAKAFAQGDVDISSTADATEITIGDRLHYRISVTYPEGGRIELPSVLGNLGAFEVKDYETSSPEKEKGRLKQKWSFTLSTFTVGDYVIPPQVVEYKLGADSVAQSYMTQPIAIKVKRTSPETVKEIADIAPPLEPAVRRPWWLVIAIVFLATAALLAWRLWKNRRRPKAAEEKPLAPPYEEARQALAGLHAVQLVRQNRARELCFELSHLLRRYLSRRYDVDALESTSSEFIALAAELPLPLAQKPFVPRFCEITDPVKFAGLPLLESEAQAMVDDLHAFLEATRPTPEAKP